jgi:hypothetical protein
VYHPYQVLQKEREFYVLEMQADRELKARLDPVLTYPYPYPDP